jgi:hypothetical protein
MKNFIESLLATAAFGVLTLACGSATAQASTTSLAGWSTVGDVISQSDAITLTTAYLDGGADQASNVSGQSAIDIAAIEIAAGMAPYALDLSATEVGTEGSLVSQSFAATAGQTLRFDWSFTSLDSSALDHAFVVLDGEVFTLATSASPGAASQSFSRLIASTGLVRLAFGVIDTHDVAGVSSLRVSRLTLTGEVAAVPEPAEWMLLAAGLGLVAWNARKRARA